MNTARGRQHRRVRRAVLTAMIGAACGFGFVGGLGGGVANAAACSATVAIDNCAVGTNLTVTAGTLTLEHSPNLYWSFVGTGYDQWESGSATPLTACAASGNTTSCSSGTAPVVMVDDATGTASGWEISEYLTGNDLPTGSTLQFYGAGTAYGQSINAAVTAFPFAGHPATTCDGSSSCAVVSTGLCNHPELGVSSCPVRTRLTSGTDATHQIGMLSTAAGSGVGAVCLASGTATGPGCAGTTNTAMYDLGMKGGAAAGTYTGAVINLTVSSGP